MSRMDGTQPEDRGRIKAWVGIPAEVSDKDAVLEKDAEIDGKTKKAGSRGPGF